MSASMFLVPNGSFIVIVMLLFAVAFVLPLWALISAALTPTQTFESVGKSKTTWVVCLAVSTGVFAPIAAVLAIYYLVALRPKLRSAVLA